MFRSKRRGRRPVRRCGSRPRRSRRMAGDVARAFRGVGGAGVWTGGSCPRSAVRIAVTQRGVTTASEGAVGGPAVYQVARTAAAAHAGQVLVTETAWDGVRGLLAGSRSSGTRAARAHGRRRRDPPLQILPKRSTAARSRSPRRSGSGHQRTVWGDGVFGRAGDLAALSELVGLGVRSVAVTGRTGWEEPPGPALRPSEGPRDGRFPVVSGCAARRPDVSALCRATAWRCRSPSMAGRRPTPPSSSSGSRSRRGERCLLVIEGMERHRRSRPRSKGGCAPRRSSRVW